MLEKEEFLKLCKLAKISIYDEEYHPFISKLNDLFDWVSELKKIDVSEVDLHGDDFNSNTCSISPEREDISIDIMNFDNEEILSNAPAHKFNMFSVPKIVE